MNINNVNDVSISKKITMLFFVLVFSLFFLISFFGIEHEINSEPIVPFIEPLKGHIAIGFRETYFNIEEGKYYRHTGIDIEPGGKKEVYASGNGIVTYKGISPIGGKTIVIKHNEKIRTTYLNLSEMLVSKGQRVARGQLIGRIGAEDDPSSAGEHLHLGVIYEGKYLDPGDLLSIDYRNISKFIHLQYIPSDLKIDFDDYGK